MVNYRGKPLTNEAVSWLLLITLALIWGSSFILIKKGLAVLTSLEVASIRVISAGLFMLPLVIRRFAVQQRSDWLYLFVVGFSGSFFPALLFAVAQTQISSSLSGVLNSLTPVFVLLIGALFFKQRISIFGFGGVSIGLLGSVLLISGFSFSTLWNANAYALFVVGATICYGVNLNIIKFKLVKLSPLSITGISVLLVFPLAVFVLLGFTDFSSRAATVFLSWELWAVVLLGVAGTGIALLLFNKMVKISSPLFAGSVTYLIPVVAIFWGLLDDEKLLFYHYLGLVLIITGIILINKRPAR